MPRQARFKYCASCLRSFSVSDEHQCCLCCLSEVHVAAWCSICHCFLPRTREAHELCLRKFLMDAAMHPHAPQDPHQRPAPLLAHPTWHWWHHRICLSSIVCIRSTHGHKSSSPMGTAPNHVSSPSHASLGEKSRADNEASLRRTLTQSISPGTVLQRR